MTAWHQLAYGEIRILKQCSVGGGFVVNENTKGAFGRKEPMVSS